MGEAVAIIDPSAWAQFGLGGLVIMVLFVSAFLQNKSHREERTEWRAEAFNRETNLSQERKETRDDQARRDEKLTDALNGLQSAVRDSSRNHSKN